MRMDKNEMTERSAGGIPLETIEEYAQELVSELQACVVNPWQMGEYLDQEKALPLVVDAMKCLLQETPSMMDGF